MSQVVSPVKGRFYENKKYGYMVVVNAVDAFHVHYFNLEDKQDQTYSLEEFNERFVGVENEDEPTFFRVVKGKIERGTEHSVGFDVFYTGKSAKYVTIAGKRTLVDNPEGPVYVGDEPILLKTGLYTEMSTELAAILKERSGLGLEGFELKAGVIDSDYTKEWGVVARFPMRLIISRSSYNPLGHLLIDPTWDPKLVVPGDKIAQFIVIRKPDFELVEGVEGEVKLPFRVREGGFGSTGS